MAKKGKLGALNQIKKGIASVSDEAYADPANKHLGDWAWKPLKEVTAKLEVTEVPDYVQKGYGDFMKMQAARAAAGNLNKRDLAKAFGITQSSIGRGGLPHASATKAGLKVPNTGELVRPEGAFAEWLGSKMGQRYLKAAERGEIDPEAIADIQAKFSPFGKPNQLAEQLAYGATDLVQRPEDISKIVGGDKEAFRDFAQSIKGINQAKAGFIGSLLGRGDLPTLDARQLNLHTLPPEGVKVESVMKRGKHAGAREAVDRLIARQKAMGLDLDPSLDPFYQHLTHHTAWDKASNSKTTHDDLVRAMRGYGKGGKVGALNRMVKAVGDVSDEARGVSMANSEANLAKFLDSSHTPMRLYHGTTATEGGKGQEAIRRLKPSKEGAFGPGVYMTPDTEYATGYTGIPAMSQIKRDIAGESDYARTGALKMLNRMNKGEVESHEIGGNMLPLHAKILNPLVVDMVGPGDPNVMALMTMGVSKDKAYDIVEKAYEKQGGPGKHVYTRAKALGHDAMIIKRNGKIQEVVSYNPNAVKSAIGNRGTYDINEADLSKAHGGLVHLAKGGGKLGAVKRMGRAISNVSNEADQMTPAAGGLRFADTPRGGPSIIKEKGGNWLSGSVEQGVKRLKRKVATENIDRYTPEEVARLEASGRLEINDAINNWVDRNLTNYIKKEMATPEDPVRRLAEEGVTHFPVAEDPRYWARRGELTRGEMGGTQMAQSDLAKQWENRTDHMINRETAQQHQDMMNLAPEMYSKNLAWINKLPPETSLYSTHGVTFNTSDLGFDHIVDVLKEDLAAGRIRPEQLSKISMEQAVRRTHAYDQQKAKEMAETALKQTEGMPVHKEYPEGYKWIELAEPKMPDVLPEGWSEPVQKGNALQTVSPEGKIVLGFNLPDLVKNIYKRHPETPGNPKNALEDALDYEGKTMGHCVGGYCPDVISGKSRIYSLRDAKGEPHVTVEVEPTQKISEEMQYKHREKINDKIIDYFADNPNADSDEALSYALSTMKDDFPPRIKQIKGKGNARPIEKYDPYTQDFVKGGEWSNVDDLHHTGLVNLSELNESPEFLQQLKNHFGNAKYATDQEIEAVRKQGMRDGGAVNPGQHDYNDGGAAFGVYPKAGMEPNPKSDEHLKRMVAIAKQHAKEFATRLEPSEVKKQYAKAVAAQMVGGGPDAIGFVTDLVVDPVKDMLFRKPRYRSVLEGKRNPNDPRESEHETEPMFGNLADAMKSRAGHQIGGANDIIARLQESGLMYGKTYDNILDEDDQPIQSGRFGLMEILGAIPTGFAANAALKKAPMLVRKGESGLNHLSSEIARPFTPATLTMEGVAPDLGTFKGSEWQNYLTNKLIMEKDSPVGMNIMGGQKTKKTSGGQGLYENKAGDFESNPLIGVDIPKAGNLSKNKALLADIGTAGRELGQEMVAAHRFVPMLTNQIKDATAMLIKGPGGRPLTKEEVLSMADKLKGMVVTHNPGSGGLFVAPYDAIKGTQPEFIQAQQAAQEVLGRGAKIQYGKADAKKDLMYRGDYEAMGARPPSAESIKMRRRLQRHDPNFPKKLFGSPSTPQTSPPALTSTID